MERRVRDTGRLRSNTPVTPEARYHCGRAAKLRLLSPGADAIQWGGGVVAEFFRGLQLQNHIFTQH